MQEAIVYTTPTCQYCRQVKQFLSANDIPFAERDVSQNRAAAEEMVKRTGQMGVPVTIIGGDTVIGFDRPRLQRIIQRLKETPKPATLGASVKDVSGGVLVGTIRSGMPAARAGLQPGDLIIAVDGTPVGDTAALGRLIQAARARGQAKVTVQRDGSRTTLPLSFPTA